MKICYKRLNQDKIVKNEVNEEALKAILKEYGCLKNYLEFYIHEDFKCWVENN